MNLKALEEKRAELQEQILYIRRGEIAFDTEENLFTIIPLT